MRLHAAAGTGIRAPDALEIAFTDNPGLKPERSRSVEAGVDQALFGERVVAGATAFFNRYEDLIVAVGPAIANASQYRTDNISNARSRGVELSAALRPARGFDARVSYTFLSTEILAVDNLGVAPAPFEVGDPLLRRPRHQASFDLTWTRGPLVAFATGGRARTDARRGADVWHLRRALREPGLHRGGCRAPATGSRGSWMCSGASAISSTGTTRRPSVSRRSGATRCSGCELLQADRVGYSYSSQSWSFAPRQAERCAGRTSATARRVRVGAGRRPRRHPRAERLGQDDAAEDCSAACCTRSTGAC